MSLCIYTFRVGLGYSYLPVFYSLLFYGLPETGGRILMMIGIIGFCLIISYVHDFLPTYEKHHVNRKKYGDIYLQETLLEVKKVGIRKLIKQEWFKNYGKN